MDCLVVLWSVAKRPAGRAATPARGEHCCHCAQAARTWDALLKDRPEAASGCHLIVVESGEPLIVVAATDPDWYRLMMVAATGPTKDATWDESCSERCLSWDTTMVAFQFHPRQKEAGSWECC